MCLLCWLVNLLPLLLVFKVFWFRQCEHFQRWPFLPVEWRWEETGGNSPFASQCIWPQWWSLRLLKSFKEYVFPGVTYCSKSWTPNPTMHHLSMGAAGVKPLWVSHVSFGVPQESQANRLVTMDVHKGDEQTQKLEQAGPRSGCKQIGAEWGYGWIDHPLQETWKKGKCGLLGRLTTLHLAPVPAQCLVFTRATPGLKLGTFRAVPKLAGKDCMTINPSIGRQEISGLV